VPDKVFTRLVGQPLLCFVVVLVSEYTSANFKMDLWTLTDTHTYIYTQALRSFLNMHEHLFGTFAYVGKQTHMAHT